MPREVGRQQPCDGVREALSARLDGEEAPVDRADADAHLVTCPDCRRWLDDAAAVTRLVRTSPAAAGPDLTEAVLPAAPGRWRSWMVVGLRVALGALGVAQLGLGLLQVTVLGSGSTGELHGTTVDGATPGHLWHESAAWNIAIGAGFLWAAVRRGRPAGIVPILTVFLGALVLLDLTDLAAGRVELARLASHGFVLCGYLVVLALFRLVVDPTQPGRPDRARGRWRATARSDPTAVPETVVPLPSRDRSQPAARTRRREAA